VLEILDTTTAAFEFLSRMAEQKLVSPEAVITFDMHGVDGRLLTGPTNIFRDSDLVSNNAWCQESEFRVERQETATDFQICKRELALVVARNLCEVRLDQCVRSPSSRRAAQALHSLTQAPHPSKPKCDRRNCGALETLRPMDKE